MTIHPLTTSPPPDLAAALEEFEQSFRYPLGSQQSFRISHGREYLPFFQAMGEATVLVAEHAGQVLGTLVLIRRTVSIQTASESTEAPAYYLCDLKLRAEWRRSPLLARLIAFAQRHLLENGCRRCYCVVMDGTGRLPTDYTGRLGIPPFERLGEIMIMRLSPHETLPNETTVNVVSAAEAEQYVPCLRSAGVAAVGGQRSRRSRMTPLGLVESSGQACGILEDTRRGKSLYLESGEELLSAHLSNWTWANPQAGSNVLKQAVATGIQNGFPALFAAVPKRHYPQFVPLLRPLVIQEAPATIFGAGFSPAQDWWIDTAEI
jgi:hypothetical protein